MAGTHLALHQPFGTATIAMWVPGFTVHVLVWMTIFHPNLGMVSIASGNAGYSWFTLETLETLDPCPFNGLLLAFHGFSPLALAHHHAFTIQGWDVYPAEIAW